MRVSTHGRNPPLSRAFQAEPRSSPRSYTSMTTAPPCSRPQATKKPLVSVFDWDDTLCPTTWLHHRGLLVAHGLIDGAPPMEIETFEQKPAPTPLTPSDRQRLEMLEHQVLQLLQLAARFGPVFIVTAASLPWVVASAEHFLPRVRQFLLENQQHGGSGECERLQVVSARDWYHHHVGSGGTQLDWKCATFDALCSHLRVQEVFARLKTRTDLVSVGDARFEQKACVMMEVQASEFLRSKTIKLLQQPTLEELLEQLRMTCKMYLQVCQYDGGLHLCVGRKQGVNNTQWQFGDKARVVDGSECVLETLQLVQIGREMALDGPVIGFGDERLRQLLAAADSMTGKNHWPVTTARSRDHDLGNKQNERPLAAVPGVQS
ncbi:unnamed protein product [Phytophthora fragariaefolia]|uniref:Unnamed protein product n=1 Tax=Phytophthora fragariaefolia TaxID=1490495 RepID=A0A9W6YF63_9STRA|nr:unnamed protein product [Phytophthora fragariaefolia]